MDNDINEIKLYSDGLYRWYYELNMWTNPSVFLTVMKILGAVTLGLGLFVSLWIEEDIKTRVQFVLSFWGIGLFLCFFLGGLAYVLYALFVGGRYCVVFEMNDKGITHTQLDKQFSKSQIISVLLLLTAAGTGKPGLSGTGLLVGNHSSMHTTFAHVTRLKSKKKRSVIYLREFLSHNQIYVPVASFDFVLQYMMERLPEKAKRLAG